jgi:hypothetical protein
MATADARQIGLWTPEGAARGKVNPAYIETLNDKMRAMDLALPTDLRPFYEHLAHYTIWEAVGGAEVTHQAIKNCMAQSAPSSVRRGFGAPRVIPCGDCFRFAVRQAARHVGTVVHARVKDPWSGKRFVHAWFERDGKVYDWQTIEMRQQPPLTVEAFYRLWKPTRVVCYSDREAVRRAFTARHYGPWSRT